MTSPIDTWFDARTVALGGVAALLVLILPSTAAADGFVDETGTLWAKAGYRSWSADETFAGPKDLRLYDGSDLGDPVPFEPIEKGEMRLQMFELQAEFVPVRRLEVGLYMPVWQQMRFSNINFTTVTTGTGDIRPYVGYQLTPTGAEVGTTLAIRSKIPTTSIERDVQSIPISEGQYDVALEHATSWDPIDRLRLTLETLARYRAPGDLPWSGTTYKPGNEAELALSVGGAPVTWAWMKAGYRGLWSRGWQLRDPPTIEQPSFRAVQELRGSVYLQWGRWIGGPLRGAAVDIGLTWPFAGRDYPQGLSWAVGLAWQHDVELPWEYR